MPASTMPTICWLFRAETPLRHRDRQTRLSNGRLWDRGLGLDRVRVEAEVFIEGDRVMVDYQYWDNW
ncbi:hypothetical protein [Nocardia macrotermitis]|uniref:hypothetical protein n=1 Tax=Nocardia macrotermitis TaxID=2585198 RepID=UPI001294C0BF|nr:hypothetical protein [Nocardia macrotermitis]